MSGRSQMTPVNGKRPNPMPVRYNTESSAQHFDLIKYICDSWDSVSRELNMSHNQSHGDSRSYRNGASVTYYQEREPNPLLKANLLNVTSGSTVIPNIGNGLLTPRSPSLVIFTNCRTNNQDAIEVIPKRDETMVLATTTRPRRCLKLEYRRRDENFEPFNLEAWWGRRVVQSITRNANS